MKDKMKDPIRQAQQRAFRYGYIDGSMEFVLGSLCLLLGVYFYAQATIPEDSLAYKILSIALLLVVIGGTLLANQAVRLFKERVTYPRTGFVAYRRSLGMNRWVRVVMAGGIGMLMAALISLLFTRYQLGAVWMPAITGVVFGLVFLTLAYRTALLRLYWLSLSAILAGGGLMLAGIGDILGLAYFYGIMAAALLLSGVITLVGYLRQNQPPEAQDEQ